jgi:hypothetical protein
VNDELLMLLCDDPENEDFEHFRDRTWAELDMPWELIREPYSEIGE